MIRIAVFAVSLLFASVTVGSTGDASPVAASADLPPSSICHYSSGGSVTYNGQTSAGLAACLDGAPGRIIHTLNITSDGGDAAQTLALARRYEGRIGHVVVQGWCASSCANYILPIADTITVPDNAYVVLHGSYSAQTIIDDQKKLAVQLHKEHPKNTYHFSPTADEARAIEADQKAFEKRRLSCPEWLHPNVLPPSQLNLGFPVSHDTISVFFVSSTMAQRCLKHTRILAYWIPPRSQRTEKKLRANHGVLLP